MVIVILFPIIKLINNMKTVFLALPFSLLLSNFTFAQSDRDNMDGSRQWIAEDLYVTGSLGIGYDMVNGYSFGFNTMVMMENNLRILFDDNSNSSSFPSRSWQIEINSSANGGEDYFRINDIDESTAPFSIMGMAPNHSLYIKGISGDIGLGTSTPAVELHMKDGDTPTLRLEQSGSGYSPQTWDVAGNEANFFIRDVTHSSYLPFKIIPGTPSNSLVLKSGGSGKGNIGINVLSPQHNLEVDGDAQINEWLYFGDESTDGNWRVSVVNDSLTFQKRESGVWVTKVQMD